MQIPLDGANKVDYRHWDFYSDEVITFVCVYEDSKYRQMALIGFDT